MTPRWPPRRAASCSSSPSPARCIRAPHHTTFFLHGKEALTARLLQPVLVDAKTARVTDVPRLPRYLTALLLSQPLHFGDYAGLPMKLIRAALDIATPACWAAASIATAPCDAPPLRRALANARHENKSNDPNPSRCRLPPRF